MVGVHGGSKGCLRCRKRKVKCDESRPICMRCEKGGYECGGYRDPFQFDSRSATKNSARSLVLSRNRSKWMTDPRTTPVTEIFSPNASSDTELELESRTDYHIPVPKYLGLRPFSEDFCVSYTNVHLMRGSGDSQSPWAIPGITSFGNNTLVRDSILALSFSFFGSQYCDKATLKRGVMLYASVLGRLNKVLGDSAQNRSVPTLESIMVLTLYEVLMGNSLKSFMTHVLGLEALLKLLGPEEVSGSYQALELLEISRPVIVSACTLSLKETILAAPEWKTVPWSKGLRKKSDLQLLYDVMVHQPSVTLYVVDPVTPGLRLRHNRSHDVDILYVRTCQLLTEYNAWFIDWNARHAGHMLEFAPMWAPTGWYESNRDLPWSKVWHFSAITIAQAYIAYQAGMIVCSRIASNLEESGLLTVTHRQKDRASELEHAAIEICRCVEWLLSEQRRGAGGLYLLMPSRCAWKTFPPESAGRRWMLAATRDIGRAHRGGWAMADSMSRQLKWHINPENGTERIDVPEAEA